MYFWTNQSTIKTTKEDIFLSIYLMDILYLIATLLVTESNLLIKMDFKPPIQVSQ